MSDTLTVPPLGMDGLFVVAATEALADALP